MKKLAILCVLSTCMLMTACSSDDVNEPKSENQENTDITSQIPKETPYTQIRLNTSQKQIKNASNDFAFNLIKEISEDNGNVVFSPYSLFACLSMAANGDTGATRDMILEALGVGSGPDALANLNSFNALMAQELPNADSRATALTANSLWIDSAVSAGINPDFINALTNYCATSVEYADFSDESGSMNLINQWCSNHTNGFIPQIINEPLKCIAALINASYFKGWWSKPFNEKATQKLLFRNINGTTANVDMIRDTRNVLHATANGMKVIALPYGNGNFRMVLAMPENKTGFNNFFSSLNYDEVATALNNGTEDILSLCFPKFNVSTSSDILHTLIDYFDTDYPAILLNNVIINDNVAIGKIMQKVTVSTDEMGTVGAAATEIELYAISNGNENIENFNFDRPFVFFIEETSTGTVLFIGKVTGF